MGQAMALQAEPQYARYVIGYLPRFTNKARFGLA